MDKPQLTGLTESHLNAIQIGSQIVKVNALIERDLLALVDAAKQAGFELNVASGFRDFERQKSIWNNKFSGKTAILDNESHPLCFDKLTEQERLFSILRWSAIPGASRHHWGTDLDVYAANWLPDNTNLQLEPWEYLTGHQTQFYSWLQQNIQRFGFFFPYKSDLGGVAPEPWHISHRVCSDCYLAELSKSSILDTLKKSNILGLEAIEAHFDIIYAQYITNIFRDE